MNRTVQIALVALFAVGLGTLAAWFLLGDGLESLVSPPSSTAQVAVGGAGMPVAASAPTRAAPPARAVPDAEQAPLPLEQSADAGRATPAATLQTLVWAVINQEDAALARCIAIEPAARAKAEAFLARLPPNARNAYRTPEQLVALYVARDVLQKSSYQILKVVVEGDSALVTLRTSDGRTERFGLLPMRRTPEGWAIPLPAGQMDDLLRETPRFVPE